MHNLKVHWKQMWRISSQILYPDGEYNFFLSFLVCFLALLWNKDVWLLKGQDWILKNNELVKTVPVSVCNSNRHWSWIDLDIWLFVLPSEQLLLWSDFQRSWTELFLQCGIADSNVHSFIFRHPHPLINFTDISNALAYYYFYFCNCFEHILI